jgi:hypothetical protein
MSAQSPLTPVQFVVASAISKEASVEELGYIDGMGESGLSKLAGLWRELTNGRVNHSSYFVVFRVPLAASEEEHRGCPIRYATPPTWQQIREDNGIGRYEVVLMGPPPMVEVDGWKRILRSATYALFPWLDGATMVVPRGRACAAMFDAIDFGMIRPPMPKPLAVGGQGELFNKNGAPLPAYVAGSDTSFLAAEAVASKVTEYQQRVLNVALSAGTRGVTCDEVEAILDMPHQTISARINELMKARKPRGEEEERPQMLFDSGARRKTRHGQQATVWVHRTVLFG